MVPQLRRIKPAQNGSFFDTLENGGLKPVSGSIGHPERRMAVLAQHKSRTLD